jgi:hypothetical protein
MSHSLFNATSRERLGRARIMAFRKAGNTAKNDHVADANSFRLERKRGVRERIEYLTRQAEERIAEKRAALEEHQARLRDSARRAPGCASSLTCFKWSGRPRVKPSISFRILPRSDIVSLIISIDGFPAAGPKCQCSGAHLAATCCLPSPRLSGSRR